jgi:hypothetical protein
MVLPYITDFTFLTKMGQTSTPDVSKVEHASRHSFLSAYKAILKPHALFENFRLPYLVTPTPRIEFVVEFYSTHTTQ